jgi:hypothetical protein
MYNPYRLGLVGVLLALFFASCSHRRTENKKIDWTVTLDAADKKPYGAYLAYESLPFYFPEAKVDTIPKGFRFNNIYYRVDRFGEAPQLLILVGLKFQVSPEEWKQLHDFIKAGNEVMIFCSYLDSNICNDLHLVHHDYSGASWEEEKLTAFRDGSDNEGILSIFPNDQTRYGYKGRYLHRYFEALADSDADFLPSTYDDIYEPDTLGQVVTYDAHEKKVYKPDFIRYTIDGKYSRGHLTLHYAPLVLSNYFLLQGHNKDYLAAIWNTLPTHIYNIYWGSFRNHSQATGLGVLWAFPPIRWALLLSIFGLLWYVLFELKRRQKAIAVVPPLKNESVEFVETIGQLYYNSRDHGNLADKIIQQFLEQVRLRYRLNTSMINSEFAHQLSIRSGVSEALAQEVCEQINVVRLRSIKIDEAYLYSLYNNTQQFQK